MITKISKAFGKLIVNLSFTFTRYFKRVGNAFIILVKGK